MRKSTIKTTPGDCLRLLYRRKTLIILPLLGIACCFAFYSFRIADEIFKTENSLLVIDEKTGKPLLADPAMTSEAARRVERSVGRVVSRNGTLAVIAGVERLATQFPDSELLQGKRLDVLREKQTVLDFRIAALEKRKMALNAELQTTSDDDKRRLILARLRAFIDDGNALAKRRDELDTSVALAERKLGEIRREAAGFESMGFAPQAGDGALSADYREYLARREECNRRLEEFAARFEENLTLRFVDGTVTAAYESADPMVCRDVVDEVLYRVECESIGEMREETRADAETLAERIADYEKALARRKGIEIEIASIRERMKVVPPVLKHDVNRGVPEDRENLKTRLAELQAERSHMVASGTASQAELDEINSQIQYFDGAIRGSSTLEVSTVESERNPLYDDLADRLAAAERELAITDAEIGICKLRLDDSDAPTAKGPQTASAGIRFEKSVPTLVPVAPFKPNRRAMILLGLALGALASLIMLLVAESASRTIRNRRDVTRVLGVPLLGGVPTFERRGGEVRPTRRLTVRSLLGACAALTMAAGLAVAYTHDNTPHKPAVTAQTPSVQQQAAVPTDDAPAETQKIMAPEQETTEPPPAGKPVDINTILPVFESDAEPDAPQEEGDDE